jgi:CheY-like chemotaxis protein
MLQEEHPSVAIKVDLDPALPAVNASEPHLLRVIGNLIRNACEAVSGQGEVRIATARVRTEEARVGMEVIPPGSYVTVRVIDTGMGIDPKHLPRLFEPFFSTKAKTRHSGTGLGLAVVHGIVKDHAGFLDVKSEPGKGSVFEFLLPRIEESPAPKVVEDVRVRTGSGHILVVDDAEAQRIMAKRMLARLGYSVTAVENGHEGVRLFKEALDKGIAKAFDLVMLDMVMEDGYDGLDTTEDILKLYPAQKLFVVSGFAHNDRVRQAISRGAGWLAKPYTLAELAETVATQMSANPSPP